MLNLPSRRTKHSPSQASNYRSSIRNFWCLALVSSGCFSFNLPLLAGIPAPGTEIKNTATGSFVDEADPTAVPTTITSNTVSVTYAEVAGVSVSSPTAAEAPATITNPGDYQGDNKVSAGDLVYYDFVITNIGNDPTQFFIPGIATVTGGTVEGPLQIISYNCGCSVNSPTVTPATPISVPVTGQRTGKDAPTSPSANLLGDDGTFEPTGRVTVRVAVRVPTTATVGSPITVKLGNTTPDVNNSTDNQPKSGAGADEVYTIDNNATLAVTNETTGTPANGEREASNTANTTLVKPDLRVISGRVFDDVNYGGGAGRDYNTANTSAQASGFTNNQIARAGAIVELYKLDMLLASTTTDASGFYKFPRLQTNDTDNYTVRVVNSSVTSVRDTAGTSGAVAVQTFRTTNTGNTGTLAGVTDHVGGENPAAIDAPANTTSQMFSALDSVAGQKIQSPALIALKTTGTDVTTVDFGYNFDTIVNTKDSGQGSLRQFITNSNALPNTNLKQDFVAGYSRLSTQAANQEVSIFMIPDGQAKPGINTGDANQLATSTANQNAGVITLTSPLPAITDPKTSIDGTTQTANIGNTNSGTTTGTIENPLLVAVNRPEIAIDLGGTTLQATNTADNVIMRGFAFYDGPVGSATSYAIDSAAKDATFTALLGGTKANGTNTAVAQNTALAVSGKSTIDKNYFADNNHSILVTTGAQGTTITDNIITTGGRAGILTKSITGVRIQNNDISGMNTASTTQKGVGILLDSASQNITITQNSIYNNSGLGIDFSGDGVTPNNSPASGINVITTGTVSNPMNYPIVLSHTLTGNILRLKGFVGGSTQAGSPFVGAAIEVFKADKQITVPPTIDDAGNAILNDNTNKSHGEGKIYLATAVNSSNNTTAVVDANGNFDFSIDITGKLVKGDEITLTATLGGNTSEFSSVSDPFKTPAKILVVKRITRVGNQDLTNITDISGGIYDPALPNTYDNHPNWPSGYLQGVRNLNLAKKIEPGAELEYTLYFINVGEQDGQKVKICDFITPYQVYKPNTYNLAGNSDGGYGDMGLELAIGQSGLSNTIKHLSGLQDPDRGEYFAPGVTTPARCQASGNTTNTTGAIAVDVTNSTFADIPGSTSTQSGVSTPVPNSYGYIRFKTRVE